MRVGEEQSKGLNSLGGRGEGNQDTGSPDSHLIPLETGGKGDPPVAMQRPPLEGRTNTPPPHTVPTRMRVRPSSTKWAGHFHFGMNGQFSFR